MSFYKYRMPLRSEFDTEEEYQEALKYWEYAESEWEDEAYEKTRE